MRYDPRKHHRRSIRMRGYDYTQPGAYFVTICTHNRECLFDDPVLRRVVETHWLAIPKHAPGVTLDAWVVMPNHVHGIIVIDDRDDVVVGARHSELGPAMTEKSHPVQDPRAEAHQMGNVSPLQTERQPVVDIVADATPGPNDRPRGVTPGSLGAIVGNFKSVTTRRINRIRHRPGGRVWQRDYYEHIVRDERALARIREYIHDNPARWRDDIENPATSESPTLKETAAYYRSVWGEET